MAKRPSISFSKSLAPAEGDTLVLFTDESLALTQSAAALGIGDLVARAAATAQFKGKGFAHLDLLAPSGVAASRILVFGLGKADELKEVDWSRLGGAVMGALRKGETAVLLAERADGTAVTRPRPPNSRWERCSAPIRLIATRAASRVRTTRNKRPCRR